jgi:hypothetical protein
MYLDTRVRISIFCAVSCILSGVSQDFFRDVDTDACVMFAAGLI